MNPVELLDHAGVALFAATGALAASRKRLDIIGFLFIGAVTGISGGTVRDLVPGVPASRVGQLLHIQIGATVAVRAYLSAPEIVPRYRLLLWLDAVALATCGVVGGQNSYMVTGPSTPI